MAPILSGEGPFTVFAPTGEAFATLPAGTCEPQLLPENKEKLAGIFTYQVVAGKTVNGGEITIKLVIRLA